MRKLFFKIKQKPIPVIIVGTFLLRVPIIFLINPLVFRDCRAYHKLAKFIAAGMGYGTAHGPSLYRPPLYPAFMSLVYSVAGASPVWVVVLQAALSAATCYFVYRITLALWDKKAAVVAALFWAVATDTMIYSGLIMTETLYMFLVGLVLWLLVSYGGGWRPTIAGGALLGLLALTRGAALAFVPLALAWIFRGKRAGFAKAAVAAAVFLAVITPWLVRNWRVTGEPQPIDCNSGINIYLGNHYNGKGEYYPQPKNERPFYGKGLKPWEKNKLAYGEAVRNAIEHPFSTLRVIGLKVFYVVFPSGDKLYLKRGATPPLLFWICASAAFFEVIVVGLAGYLAKGDRTEGAGILWLYAGSAVAVMIVVFFAERFRMTAYPAAVPLSAAGWVYLFGEKTRKRGFIAVAILILLQVAAGAYIYAFRPNVVEKIGKFFFGG